MGIHLLVGQIFGLLRAEYMIMRRQLCMCRIVILCPALKVVIFVVHLHELIKELAIQLVAGEVPVCVVVVIHKSSALVAGLSLRVEFIGSVFRHKIPPFSITIITYNI